MSNRRDIYLPYHIDFEKWIDKNHYNPDYSEHYHKHNQSGIIRTIYKEPFAFYLTQEDKTYYSESELKAIQIVQKIAIESYNSTEKLKTNL